MVLYFDGLHILVKNCAEDFLANGNRNLEQLQFRVAVSVTKF